MSDEQLTLFEGQPAADGGITFSGGVAGSDSTSPGTYALGQEVIFVVRGVVKGISGKTKDGAAIRSQSVAIEEAYIVDDSTFDEAQKEAMSQWAERLQGRREPADPETGEVF